MPRIILIETSTSLCSTALIEGREITSYRESSKGREHAAMTAVFIKEMLEERGLKVSDCDAVCLSSGPGSYTGLRVGSSSAKGLCFGAGIPLLAVGTLDILAGMAVSEGLLPEGCNTIIPMIDARRMEVYSAVYSFDCPAVDYISQSRDYPEFSAGSEEYNPQPKHCSLPQRLTEVKAVIVEKDSFREELEAGPVLFIGDGAEKCRGTLTSPNAEFFQICPNAKAMLTPALEAWDKKRFENTAYFEPFYLKDFVATISRKNLFQ